MERSEYNELMAKIADGGKVSQKTFDTLVAFAKAKKTKRPDKAAIIDEAAIKEAATTVGTKAAKAKGPKPKCSVTKEQDDKLTTKQCQNDSRSNGMCSKHYSRLVYRANPENAQKARDASNAYAARQRDAKKAAEAKAAA